MDGEEIVSGHTVARDHPSSRIEARPATEPISPEELERVHRDNHARAGWAIIRALLNSPEGVTLQTMAAKIGRKWRDIEARLIDPRRIRINDISDFALALEAEPRFRVRRRGEWFAHEPEPPFRIPSWFGHWTPPHTDTSGLALLSDGALGRQDGSSRATS